MKFMQSIMFLSPPLLPAHFSTKHLVCALQQNVKQCNMLPRIINCVVGGSGDEATEKMFILSEISPLIIIEIFMQNASPANMRDDLWLW